MPPVLLAPADPLGLAVHVRATAPVRAARLWLDGKPLAVRGFDAGATALLLRAAVPPPAGRHVVVAFARTSTSGGAVAWTLSGR